MDNDHTHTKTENQYHDLPQTDSDNLPPAVLSGTTIPTRVQQATERLKPFNFQPGQSGNPGGRAGKRPITLALREIIAQDVPGTKTSVARVLANELVLIAKTAKRPGDRLKAIELILERTEGRVPQITEVAGVDGGLPVPFEAVTNRAELESRISKLLGTIAGQAQKTGD